MARRHRVRRAAARGHERAGARRHPPVHASSPGRPRSTRSTSAPSRSSTTPRPPTRTRRPRPCATTSAGPGSSTTPRSTASTADRPSSSSCTTKRGFCVQFASAYAVMARTLGIPARVAVGFTPGTRDANGTFHVSSHDAHAWPEIWLDGSGWTHLFDPTPSRQGVAPAPGGSDLPDDADVATPVTRPDAHHRGAAHPARPRRDRRDRADGRADAGGADRRADRDGTVVRRRPRALVRGGARARAVRGARARLRRCRAHGQTPSPRPPSRRRRPRGRGRGCVGRGARPAARGLARPRSRADPDRGRAHGARRRGCTRGAAAARPRARVQRGALRRRGDRADDAQEAWTSLDDLERALDDGVSWARRWRRRLGLSTFTRR